MDKGGLDTIIAISSLIATTASAVATFLSLKKSDKKDVHMNITFNFYIEHEKSPHQAMPGKKDED